MKAEVRAEQRIQSRLGKWHRQHDRLNDRLFRAERSAVYTVASSTNLAFAAEELREQSEAFARQVNYLSAFLELLFQSQPNEPQ
jgi:hypothetical protein